ncbi:MAG: hypothetical protein LBQ79_13355 [Deltaproteobacteria bacterium]|jgi:hypothetical protein|nr:hypothetical protein [Deltaproteobacteria bacterium]
MKRVSAAVFPAALVWSAALACVQPAQGAVGRGTEWSRVYPAALESVFLAAAAVPYGGAVLGGFRQDDTDAHGWPVVGDAWIVRIGADGEVAWEARLAGRKGDAVMALAGTSDGGFLVGGITGSRDGDFAREGGEKLAPWVAGLDVDGKTRWLRVLPGSGDSHPFMYALGETPGGGVAALTVGDLPGPGNGCSGKGVVFWRISANGADVSRACPGLSFEPSLDYSWAVMPDGGAAAAYSDGGRARVALMSPEGKLVWDVDTGGDSASAVCPLPGGGLAVGGTGPGGRPRLFALGPDGSLVWESDLEDSGQGWIKTIAALPDGLFAAGDTPGAVEGTYNMMAVRTFPDGRVAWSAEAGGSGLEETAAATCLKDGGCVAVWATLSRDGDLAVPGGEPAPEGGNGRYQAWALKFKP